MTTTEETVNAQFIALRFLKYCRITGKKAFSREALHNYIEAMEWSFDDFDALTAALENGDDEVVAVSSENASGDFILAKRNGPVSISTSDNHEPVTGGANQTDTSNIPHGEMENIQKEKGQVYMKKETGSKPASTKTSVSQRKSGRQKSRSQKSPVSAVTIPEGGASEKYALLAREILQNLPRNIFLGRSNILAEAEKHGIVTGNWLTLVKYLQKGTADLIVSDNGLSGNRKKYMISDSGAPGISHEKVGSDAPVAMPSISTESSGGGATIHLAEGGKPIVITIKINIGKED
ncbi:hypothetical protein KKF84_02865 [Myxococcota bacterium]|nr:hypothetical protein [Myxococcota bacterium]